MEKSLSLSDLAPEPADLPATSRTLGCAEGAPCASGYLGLPQAGQLGKLLLALLWTLVDVAALTELFALPGQSQVRLQH